MVIVHKVFAHALKHLSDDGGGLGKAIEDGSDVVSLLHGDDPGVVFLVDPNKEVSSFVVEDTTSVGPVATTSRGQKEGRVGLLEKVSSVSKSFLFFMAHTVGLRSVRSGASKGEVVTLELTIKLEQSLNKAVFDVTSLLE